MENSLIHLHPDKYPLNKCHLLGEKEVRVKNQGRVEKIVLYRVDKDDSYGNPTDMTIRPHVQDRWHLS